MEVIRHFQRNSDGKMTAWFCKLLRPPLAEDAYEQDLVFMTTYSGFSDSPEFEGEQSVITMTGVTKDGRTVLVNAVEFDPYFYVKLDDPCSILPRFEPRWATEPNEESEAAVTGLLNKLNGKIRQRHAKVKSNVVKRIELVMKTSIWGVQFEKDLFAKIVLRHPNDVLLVREMIGSGDSFGDGNSKLFECNVAFNLRMMVDRNIPGMSWMRLPAGKYRKVRQKVTSNQFEVVANVSDIEPQSDRIDFAPLRTLYWDTEQLAEDGFPNVHRADHKMILHGMVLTEMDSFGKEHYVRRVAIGMGNPEAVDDSTYFCTGTEYELFVFFAKFFLQFDADVYGGYNSMNHDMRWHIKRAKTMHMEALADFCGNCIDLCRRVNKHSNIRRYSIESGALGKQFYYIADMMRIHFDVSIPVRRDVGMPLRDYRLDSVAKKLVGEQKNPVTYDMIPKLFRGTPEEQALLWKYCVQDAELCWHINSRKMYLVNMAEIARLCRVPLMDTLTRGQSVRCQMLLLHFMRNDHRDYVMPHYEPAQKKKRSANDKKEYEGAVVLDPAIGWYSLEEHGGISTLDFASHYPKIMIAYNLCYTTFVAPERIAEVRARGIPVRQAPSPVSDQSRGVPGHHFVYPWRDCTAEEAEAKKAEAKRVRQIKEGSYLRHESPGANNDLPAIGQWQWEDPELIGLLPRIEMSLLVARSGAKKDMGAAQMKAKVLNQVIGLDALLRLESVDALHFLYQRADKLEAIRKKPIDTIIKTLVEEFCGKEKSKKRADGGTTYRAMLVEYYEGMLKKFDDMFGDDGKIALTTENVAWFLQNITYWDSNASTQDGRQMALKVVCNSLYGFTGAISGKLPMIEVGSTITAYGRDMIMFAKETSEQYDPITKTYGAVGCPHRTQILYGDTDSVMVMFWGCHNIREVNSWGRKFSKHISDLYQHYEVKLDWEKSFFLFLLLSKKRYIAYQVGENKNDDLEYKLNCKGIETTRRDNPECLKFEAEEIIKLIFFKRDIAAAVERVWMFVRRVLMRDFTLDEFAESRFVNKDAADYKMVPGFVELKEKEEMRNPGLKITGRFCFVHVYKKQSKAKKGVKARKVCALETPEFLRANPNCGLYVNTDEYIRRIKPIMSRLFANILVQDGTGNRAYPTYEEAVAACNKRQKIAERILFEGNHMNAIKMPEVSTNFFNITYENTSSFTADRYHAFSDADRNDAESLVAHASNKLRETPEWKEWHEHRAKTGDWPAPQTLFEKPSHAMASTSEYRRFLEFGNMRVEGKIVFGPQPALLFRLPVLRYEAIRAKQKKQQTLSFDVEPEDVDIEYHDENEDEFGLNED